MTWFFAWVMTALLSLCGVIILRVAQIYVEAAGAPELARQLWQGIWTPPVELAVVLAIQFLIFHLGHHFTAGHLEQRRYAALVWAYNPATEPGHDPRETGSAPWLRWFAVMTAGALVLSAPLALTGQLLPSVWGLCLLFWWTLFLTGRQADPVPIPDWAEQTLRFATRPDPVVPRVTPDAAPTATRAATDAPASDNAAPGAAAPERGDPGDVREPADVDGGAQVGDHPLAVADNASPVTASAPRGPLAPLAPSGQLDVISEPPRPSTTDDRSVRDPDPTSAQDAEDTVAAQESAPSPLAAAHHDAATPPEPTEPGDPGGASGPAPPVTMAASDVAPFAAAAASEEEGSIRGPAAAAAEPQIEAVGTNGGEPERGTGWLDRLLRYLGFRRGEQPVPPDASEVEQSPGDTWHLPGAR